MGRIFMQVYCKYPRGGALANYVENIAKAVREAGYSIILISDHNTEYDINDSKHFSMFDKIYFIELSTDENIREIQRTEGLAKERIGILEKENIEPEDVVFVTGIYNKYMLNQLFEYRDKKEFKVICNLNELFAPEDYKRKGLYEGVSYAINNEFVKADAVLAIGTYIAEFFKSKGVKTYIIPPIIDKEEGSTKTKDIDKYRFIVPTSKDSFSTLLRAFAQLEEKELSKIELHLCSMKEEVIREYLSKAEWDVISEITVIHNWLKYEELLELYRKMHFLLVARKECQRTLANFPSKVPECMNFGIVPIASEVGDYTKYYLSDGIDSIFIDGDSVESIKNSIRKAIELSEEKFIWYSNNARRTVKEKLDYRVWQDKIREMLEFQ